MDSIRKLQKMLSVRTTGGGPLVDWFVEELAATFELHQVKPTPCLLMLAEDVITHGVLVRTAHRTLNAAVQPAPKPKKGKKEDSTPPPPPPKSAKEVAGLLDDIFKYREKYRKSMSDFGQACAAAGTPIPTGLSELFASIDAKMDGVMAAAVDFTKTKVPANGSAALGAPLEDIRPDVQAIATEVESTEFKVQSSQFLDVDAAE